MRKLLIQLYLKSKKVSRLQKEFQRKLRVDWRQHEKGNRWRRKARIERAHEGGKFLWNDWKGDPDTETLSQTHAPPVRNFAAKVMKLPRAFSCLGHMQLTKPYVVEGLRADCVYACSKKHDKGGHRPNCLAWSRLSQTLRPRPLYAWELRRAQLGRKRARRLNGRACDDGWESR